MIGRMSFGWLTLASFFAAVLFPLSAASQVPGITLSPGFSISTDNPTNPYVETYLAINPRNPRNLIAASIVVERGQVGSAVYASLDGGKTWKRGRTTTKNNKIFKGGDPVVYFSPQGIAFFGSVQGTPVNFLVSRSTDDGLTWGPPVTIPGGNYDREYLAFDGTGGRYNGRIYAGGTVFPHDASGKQSQAYDIVYSTNGGRTFSPGYVIVGSQGGESPSGISPILVAPDGTVVVPFYTLAIPSSGPGSVSRLCGHLWITISRNGGDSFQPAREGPGYCQAEGYEWSKSVGAFPAAMDLSHGSHRGRIYLAYTDFDGKTYNVKAVHTDDFGKTWSAPVVVNDNTNPDSPANPGIAVNQDGIVGVVWNDRRDDPRNSCFRLYFAVSDDGGDTFLPNVRASNEPTCPLAPANWAVYSASYLDWSGALGNERRLPSIYMSGVAERWSNGGDTQGLVAGPDGVFRSAWISGDGPSGVMQLWYKEFRVDPSALPRSASSAERTDLSQQLRLKISDARVDFATHTLSVRVRLVNPLPVPFTGPFTVVLHAFQTHLKGLHAVNADNGLAGKGAFWNFSIPAGNVLRPGQESAWRELEWKFSGGTPNPPGAPLWAHFLILGEKP